MKKRLPVLFSIAVILFLIISVTQIIAQDNSIPEIAPGINQESAEKIQEGVEKLSDEEARSQYLKQEWNKILEKKEFYIKYIKPSVEIYRKISPFTDPIFKYTTGITPSLSWLFALSLILWIAFVIYMFRIFSMVSIFSKTTQTIITAGFIIILSVLGITKKASEFIIDKLSLLDNVLFEFIGVVIVILFLIMGSIFSKNLEDLFKGLKEKKEKREEEKSRKKLKAETKIVENLTKEIAK
jgi:hypothetical protein